MSHGRFVGNECLDFLLDVVPDAAFQRQVVFGELHIEFVDRIPIPLILHICGRTVDRMEYIAQTGMAAFHYDSKNDPADSMEIVRGRISLVGNINNPETLYARGPAEVRQEVYRCMDAGVEMIAPEWKAAMPFWAM